MKRLASTSLVEGNISTRQFESRSGRSTEDAILELRRMVDASIQRSIIALLFNISEAFDNACWLLALTEHAFRVLKSYSDGRRVRITWGDNEVSKMASRGCPQGSVLGAACWNLMFDDLFRLLERKAIQFVAYADD